MIDRIEYGLYWQLLGPRQFIRKAAAALTNKRCIIVNSPVHVSTTTNGAIMDSLSHTNIHGTPVSLIVRAGTDIALDLGDGCRVEHLRIKRGIVLHYQSAIGPECYPGTRRKQRVDGTVDQVYGPD